MQKKELRAPAGLGPAGRRFWKKVLTQYDLPEEHDRQRLIVASKCLDDISEAEQALEQEGRFYKNQRTGAWREHPASKLVRENRILFIRAVRELGLDLAEAEDSRPRRQY